MVREAHLTLPGDLRLVEHLLDVEHRLLGRLKHSVGDAPDKGDDLFDVLESVPCHLFFLVVSLFASTLALALALAGQLQ